MASEERNEGLTCSRAGRKMAGVKGKPKSTRQRRSALHTPPKEVVGARAAQAAWWASRTPAQLAEIERCTREHAAGREFNRNGKMPAHQPACPRVLFTANGVKVYETDEEFEARRQRLATRRAGKKFL